MARADRLEEWAAKRAAKSEAALNGARILADGIPFGQPILVGHHSEKRHRRDLDRIDSGMRRGIEHHAMATSMASRADNIRAAADHAIYSDDEDAIERLGERIAELETKREARKAANAEYRKAHRAELAAMTAYQRSQAVPWPSYSISNLGGNIGRLRERLAGLEARAKRQAAAEDAGGVIVKRSSDYAVVTFAEKPDADVRAELKAAGYWFAGGSWNGRADALPAMYKEA
jgi:hypothetical protein